jgi:hypothetical protein
MKSKLMKVGGYFNIFKKHIGTKTRIEYYPHNNKVNLTVNMKGNKELTGCIGWVVKVVCLLFGKRCKESTEPFQGLGIFLSQNISSY